MAYKNPKGGGWYADWRECGKRKRKYMANKTLAMQFEAQKKLRVMRGEVGITDGESVTLKEFYNRYHQTHTMINKKPSTQESEPFNLTRLMEIMGSTQMADITSEMIEKFKAIRLGEVKPSSINRTLAILSNVFSKAILWGVISGSNPLRHVKRFPENNSRTRYLSKDERMTLLSGMSGQMNDIVQVALNTGMRSGEIQKMRRRDIQFANKVIAIPDQKNNEYSHIPMNNACCAILSKYRDLGDGEFPFGWDFNDTFTIRVKKLGIKDFRFHDLRHTFASCLVMSGVDLNTVRELLRHKNLLMTLRYAHLTPGFKHSAVERLDTYWTPTDIDDEELNLQVIKNKQVK